MAQEEAHLAAEAEAKAMDVAGQVLWDAMAKIVSENPYYDGIQEPERSACISRLAMQAYFGVMLNQVEEADHQAYVAITSMGRMLGQVIFNGPHINARGCLELLNEHIKIGGRDYQTAAGQKGAADVG